MSQESKKQVLGSINLLCDRAVEKLTATIRSREILVSIILQSKSQLKAVYKDSMDTIEGCYDTILFPGGREKTTLKEMGKYLAGKRLTFTIPRTQGCVPVLNYHKNGRYRRLSVMKGLVPISEKCLLTLDEVAQYTGLGHQKLRNISNEDDCNFVLWNGSKRMLKRAGLSVPV